MWYSEINVEFLLFGGGGWDGSFYIGSMVFDHWKKNQNIYDMNF